MARCQESKLQSGRLGADTWCRAGWYYSVSAHVLLALTISVGRYSPLEGSQVSSHFTCSTVVISYIERRVFQAGWVGVSGRSTKRCEIAEQQGASKTFNVTAPGVDVIAGTLHATDQHGADVVFDCGGTQATMDTATHAVRRGGTIMNLALWSEKPVVDMNTLLFKEVVLASACLSLTGSECGFATDSASDSVVYADDHPEMLDALSGGRFGDLASLITRRIPLEDLMEKGIKALIHEKDQHGTSAFQGMNRV